MDNDDSKTKLLPGNDSVPPVSKAAAQYSITQQPQAVGATCENKVRTVSLPYSHPFHVGRRGWLHAQSTWVEVEGIWALFLYYTLVNIIRKIIPTLSLNRHFHFYLSYSELLGFLNDTTIPFHTAPQSTRSIWSWFAKSWEASADIQPEWQKMAMWQSND